MPPRLVLLCLCLSVEMASARMLAPLRKSTALQLLRRLVDGSHDDEISLDIGGTLAKVLLFQPTSEPPPDGQPPALDMGKVPHDPAFGDADQQSLSVYSPELGGNLHFFVFETRAMPDVISFVKRYFPEAAKDLTLEEGKGAHHHLQLRATGGGSYKHADNLRKAGIHLDLEEEMSAIISGLDFLTRQCAGELFAVDMDALGSWSPMATPAQNAQLAETYVSMPQPPSDYLYVSIGSGVSLMEVHAGEAGSGRLRYRGRADAGHHEQRGPNFRTCDEFCGLARGHVLDRRVALRHHFRQQLLHVCDEQRSAGDLLKRLAESLWQFANADGDRQRQQQHHRRHARRHQRNRELL